MKETISLFIFIILLGCKQDVKAQKEALQISQELIEKTINREASAFLKENYENLSGVVYVNGKSYQFHFGKLSNGRLANDKTIYEIGSITKTYTGILLSQAVQDKKVSLETDVRKYLKGSYPDLELEQNTPITLKHLITHTAGFPPTINCNIADQTTGQQISCFEHFTRDDFFNRLKTLSLIDKTGNNYHYSNAGVQLVGYILESVYQSSFEDLVKKYIFSRSHEDNTLFKVDYNDRSNVSLGKNSQKIPMPLINGFYNYAGGLKSSTSSILNYIKMYLDSDDSVVKQTMNRLAGNPQYGRAFAWNTYNYDQNKKMLYHNGGTLGHSSWIALYPNQKAGIFLVTNILTDQSQGDLNQLSNTIMDQLLQ
ncbi:serine hydrolase domain-containing protein [Epilithonimonas zeae]|uniref:serine hydrolase domain-containing protein n=1 Tax=Epilithonimonas zeae TaxID=1416779 RepID=UPI00200C8CC6|nr:serine hydrolase domain-containing protein [Epilithonimonas zeae]UQB69350.1 beta-lactamase family protein [Epilithonimonas zeae]